MSTVAELWAVQRTELAVESIRQRLTDLQQQLAEPAALQQARQALAAVESSLAQSRARQRDLEQQSAELRRHLAGSEREMLSGRVRNPRELEGMQANVVALQRRAQTLDEDALAALVEGDALQAQVNTQQAEVAQAQQAHAEQQAAIKHEAARKLGDLKNLSARLQQQWQGISDADKTLYKMLRSRKAGRAVALEQNGACEACGVMLPTGVVQAVHHAVQRVSCPGCGRLLLAKPHLV